MTKRVLITEKAIEVVDKLTDRYGPVMFHQSGGCCDGSQPMCFQVGDFKVGSSDVCLGKIYGCSFYMSADQFEYWQYSQLTIDATEGRGASFSLEIPLGVRFVTRSRVFTEDELKDLEPVVRCETG